jgi:hypothetical protein
MPHILYLHYHKFCILIPTLLSKNLTPFLIKLRLKENKIKIGDEIWQSKNQY